MIEVIENEICAEMFHVLERIDYNSFFHDPSIAFQEVLRFLESDKEFYKVMLQTNESRTFLEKMKRLFEQYMQATDNISEEIRGTDYYKIRISFFAGGITNLLIDWITEALQCSKEEIISELTFLLRSGFERR